jgi:predicted RNA-binding protein with PIN domain
MLNQTKAGAAQQHDAGHQEIEQLEQRAFHDEPNICKRKIRRNYLWVNTTNYMKTADNFINRMISTVYRLKSSDKSGS